MDQARCYNYDITLIILRFLIYRYRIEAKLGFQYVSVRWLSRELLSLLLEQSTYFIQICLSLRLDLSQFSFKFYREVA